MEVYMANEIRVVTKLTLVKDAFSYFWNPGYMLFGDEIQRDLTGSAFADAGIKTVTTSGTNFTLSNVTTPGYVALRNTDTTNFVDIGYDDGGTLRDLIRLNAGDVALFRMEPTRTLRGQADTASVIVAYLILEN